MEISNRYEVWCPDACIPYAKHRTYSMTSAAKAAKQFAIDLLLEVEGYEGVHESDPILVLGCGASKLPQTFVVEAEWYTEYSVEEIETEQPEVDNQLTLYYSHTGERL